MDKITAQGIFKSQILARWPDFELSAALYGDWIKLLSKYTPDDVCRASGQYVLNYDSFKRPALNKFKDILNSITKAHSKKTVITDTYPQYFLQVKDDDNCYWQHGSFIFLNTPDTTPDNKIRYVQEALERYEEIYSCQFNIVVCNDRKDVATLLEDRKNKSKQNNQKEKQNAQSKEQLADSIRKIKDSLGSKTIFKDNDTENVN